MGNSQKVQKLSKIEESNLGLDVEMLHLLNIESWDLDLFCFVVNSLFNLLLNFLKLIRLKKYTVIKAVSRK